MCGSQNSCWRWELKRHFVGAWTWTTRKSVVRRWKSKDDNVDKLFVKELQTIPLILKLYIWDNSHYTSTLGQSCFLSYLRCKRLTTGKESSLHWYKYKNLQLSCIMDLVILKIWVQMWTPQTRLERWSNFCGDGLFSKRCNTNVFWTLVLAQLMQ